MALPLLTRAADDDGTFVHVTRRSRSTEAARTRQAAAAGQSCGVAGTSRIPDRQPAPGEQFRFHVDMEACIGCKCCVVACNEQNGNPASINWRRVGEIEGGVFPAARRAYFSMGCNHCLEPTCLQGCPVDAYTKDDATGIVRHSAETCIGCQYCTWTCSYGVPQFNAERGVVGKCDMCHGRLTAGQAPACVSACPEGAIGIEIVNVAAWRQEIAQATAGGGRPMSDGSQSATRVTLPVDLPQSARPIDGAVPVPGDSHMPLVVMTVLIQLAIGAFTAIGLTRLTGAPGSLAMAATVAMGLAGLALGASTIHLGRPIHAYRAMRMWRRSWLSREVVLFGAFSQAAAAFTTLLWLEWPVAVAAGLATPCLGLAGVYASACIYRVESRPSWNSPATLVQFLLTTFLLGGLFAAAAGIPGVGLWRAVTIGAAAALVIVLVVLQRRRSASALIELRGSARLLATTFRTLAFARMACLVVGGLLVPLVTDSAVGLGAALVMATCGELAGRYLFFVTAVPKHMTTPYTFVGSEAA